MSPHGESSFGMISKSWRDLTKVRGWRMECVPCFFGRHSQTEAVCYDDHDFQRVSDVRCASRHEYGTMRPITIPNVSSFFFLMKSVQETLPVRLVSESFYLFPSSGKLSFPLEMTTWPGRRSLQAALDGPGAVSVCFTYRACTRQDFFTYDPHVGLTSSVLKKSVCLCQWKAVWRPRTATIQALFSGMSRKPDEWLQQDGTSSLIRDDAALTVRRW